MRRKSFKVHPGFTISADLLVRKGAIRAANFLNR
jgi:hypothetical protein